MAAVAVTAAQVALVFPEEAEVYPAIAGGTVTVGQALYFNTGGSAAATGAG